MPTYTPGAAAKRLGTSPSFVRNIIAGQFSEHYAGLWSSGAVPPPGVTRRLDEGDIRLLRYIREETARGERHEDISARVRSGALDDYRPAPNEDETPGPDAASNAALAVIGLAQDYANRLQAMSDAARQAEREMQERLLDAEKRATAAETRAALLQEQLDELRTKEPEHRKGLLARLFGR